MTKLELIKTKLASLLLQFATIKTDKAVLEYDGEELKAETKVFVVDENGERKPAEDGNYVTEEGKTIVVADGKVTEILEKEEEVEPTEDPVEEEKPEEELVDETPAEEPKEEETNEVVEEPKDELAEKVTALEAKVEELIAIVEKLVEKTENDNTAVDERLSKIEKMSAAKPVEAEIELSKTIKKTGDAKLDRFLERYGNA